MADLDSAPNSLSSSPSSDPNLFNSLFNTLSSTGASGLASDAKTYDSSTNVARYSTKASAPSTQGGIGTVMLGFSNVHSPESSLPMESQESTDEDEYDPMDDYTGDGEGHSGDGRLLENFIMDHSFIFDLNFLGYTASLNPAYRNGGGKVDVRVVEIRLDE